VKLVAVLLPAVALVCFIGAIFSSTNRRELVLLGAMLLIAGTFAARALRHR